MRLLGFILGGRVDDDLGNLWRLWYIRGVLLDSGLRIPLQGPLRASLALLVLLLLLLLLPVLLHAAMHLSFETAGSGKGRMKGEVADRPLGHGMTSSHRQVAWNSGSSGVGALCWGDIHDDLEAGGCFQHTGQALVEGPASSDLIFLAAIASPSFLDI